jgi:hypothetical protein
MCYVSTEGRADRAILNAHRRNTKAPAVYRFTSYYVSSQSVESEMKPLTEDRGGDKVLLGRSYRTPHGAVIDEYGAMVE